MTQLGGNARYFDALTKEEEARIDAIIKMDELFDEDLPEVHILDFRLLATVNRQLSRVVLHQRKVNERSFKI